MERQIGVGKEFDGFRLCGAHKEDWHVLLDGAFFDDGGEGVGGFFQIRFIVAIDNAARVEVVVEGLGFAEELGAKMIFGVTTLMVPSA